MKQEALSFELAVTFGSVPRRGLNALNGLPGINTSHWCLTTAQPRVKPKLMCCISGMYDMKHTHVSNNLHSECADVH